MADGANVDGCLPGDNLGSQRGKALDFEVLRLGLRGQEGSLDCGGRDVLFHGGLERLVLDLIVGVVGVNLRLVVGAGVGLDVVAILIAVGRHGENETRGRLDGRICGGLFGRGSLYKLGWLFVDGKSVAWLATVNFPGRVGGSESRRGAT